MESMLWIDAVRHFRLVLGPQEIRLGLFWGLLGLAKTPQKVSTHFFFGSREGVWGLLGRFWGGLRGFWNGVAGLWGGVWFLCAVAQLLVLNPSP